MLAVAHPLVRPVQRDVGIGVGAEADRAAGLNGGLQPDHAHMGRLPAPVPLIGQADIGAGVQHRARRAIHAQCLGDLVVHRLVRARFHIQRVVVPPVSGHTQHAALKRAHQHRLIGRGRCQRRAFVRRPPDHGTVERVLHGRAVVHRHAEPQIGIANVNRRGHADVAVVQKVAFAHARIGGLDESAGIAGDAPGQKHTDGIKREVVVARIAGRGTAILVRLRVRVGTLYEGGQRDLRRHTLAAGLGVTADLEGAAVGGQLRAESADMAGGAGLAGL